MAWLVADVAYDLPASSIASTTSSTFVKMVIGDGACQILIPRIGLGLTVAFHLDLIQIPMLFHGISHMFKPNFLHDLQLLIQGKDLIQGVKSSPISFNSSFSDSIHPFLNHPPDVAIFKLQSQLFIGDDEGGTQIGGSEGTALFKCVFSVLDCLYVLMNCCVSTYLISLHHCYKL